MRASTERMSQCAAVDSIYKVKLNHASAYLYSAKRQTLGGCENVLKLLHFRLSPLSSQDVVLNGLLVLRLRAPVFNYQSLIRLQRS